MILLQFSLEILRNARLILSCYEARLGMKINFEKSELFSIGLSEDEQCLVANLLGCKVGAFPMKYLGMPVSSYKIFKAQLSYVSEKTETYLQEENQLGSTLVCQVFPCTLWVCTNCMKATFKN
jgi:hypothetical protein